LTFYLNKIDTGLNNKPKHLLLKYVSHNFGSAFLINLEKFLYSTKVITKVITVPFLSVLATLMDWVNRKNTSSKFYFGMFQAIVCPLNPQNWQAWFKQLFKRERFLDHTRDVQKPEYRSRLRQELAFFNRSQSRSDF